MRPLTFNGFLKNYLQQLSGTETESVNKLLKLSQDNPRLRAPLALYAKAVLPEQQLGRLMQKDPVFRGELEQHLAFVQTEGDLVKFLAGGKAPAEYEKVYRSYAAKRDRVQTEQELKELIRRKALNLRAEKKISDYRAYKDLRLNPGNYHAFMRQGDVAKLSLANAKRVLEYLENV